MLQRGGTSRDSSQSGPFPMVVPVFPPTFSACIFYAGLPAPGIEGAATRVGFPEHEVMLDSCCPVGGYGRPASSNRCTAIDYVFCVRLRRACDDIR